MFQQIGAMKDGLYGNSLTFDPNICCSTYSKHKQKQDEEKCLQIIGCDTLHTKQNCSEKLSLLKQQTNFSMPIYNTFIWTTVCTM